MKGAVAAGHPLTAAAGARVLEEGGNAVDACVAAAFAAWVTESPLTGPGAGGFALVVPSDGRPARVADFFVSTPGLGSPAPTEAEMHAIDVAFGGDSETTQVFRHRRAVVRRARSGRGPRGRAPRLRPAAVADPPRACDRARHGRRRGLPCPGAPARDPRPDPPAHRGGPARVQPARWIEARPRRPAPPSRPRRDVPADRRRRCCSALPRRSCPVDREHRR